MNPVPKWFKPVAIVALIWNLFGCMSYLMDVTLSAEALAAMPQQMQDLYHARPAWSIAATAVAVWFGALGCVGLLMRKTWAMPVLGLSLLGVLAQDVWLFALSGALPIAGTVAIVLQCVVLCISIGLVVLANRANKEGWST